MHDREEELDKTLHEFKLLKKMLRYEDAATAANAEPRDPGVSAAASDAETV